MEKSGRFSPISGAHGRRIPGQLHANFAPASLSLAVLSLLSRRTRTIQASKPKRRKFKGFAVLDRSGKLIWGTIRTKKEESEKLYQSWNPDPTGEGMGERIVEVEIFLSE